MYTRAISMLAVALSACAAQGAGTEREAPRLPNVVYILADDLGYGDVSCYNQNAAWRTPHMDQLAAEGLRFTDAHSGSSVCTPTRYGVLTGRYAWRSRLKRGVLHGESPHLIAPDRMTVASLLQQSGYHTACIGKWHLGWDWPRQHDGSSAIDYSRPVQNGPAANGFDYYYCHSASLDMPPYVYVEDGRVTSPPDRETQNKDSKGFWRKGATGADFEHRNVLSNFAKRSVEYIESRAAEPAPFFLYLAFPSPHTPILPSEEFKGKSGTNAYGDFVLQTDDAIGQVVQAIDKLGISQDTIVIVTSDNGCSPRADFKELAQFGHDPSCGFRGHKADIFEGGHRVPFLVRWPGHAAAGSSSDALVCLTDLMRTCADVVGTTLPENAGEDSVSFLPSLREKQSRTDLRQGVIHHSINGSFAIRQGKWKLALCPGSGGWSTPQPANARKRGLPLVQLFNLEQDVAETTNVAEEHPEIADRLIEQLKRDVERGRSTPGIDQDNEGATPFMPEGYKQARTRDPAVAS